MTPLPSWVKPAGIVAAFVAAAALGRWSSSPDRWQAKLDAQVAASKAARLADSAAYAGRHAQDSTEIAALRRKTVDDSVKLLAANEAREAAIRTANANAAQSAQARRVLAAARTTRDTINAQARLIESQDVEITGLHRIATADTVSLLKAADVAAGLRSELAVSKRETVSEQTRAAAAEKNLADLTKVAGSRPKGFTLFGFSISLKPYIGYGLEFSPTTGTASHGIQLGLSILRG